MSAYRLPRDLWSRAESLAELGLDELAWPPEDATRVLDLLGMTAIAVLGGDVYVRRDKRFEPAYENWSVEQGPTEDPAAFAARSRAIAKTYLARLQDAPCAVTHWVTLVLTEPLEPADD